MPTNPLLDIFGRSPVKPMQEHMEKIHACVSALAEFIDAVFAEDWPRATEARTRIAQLESDAGKIKRDIRLHLPKSLFLAMDRSDLLELLSMQDRIASRAKDISGLILGRKMVFPAPIQPLYRQFLERSIGASKQALKAIHELDELVETGFRGREVALVEAMIDELSQIEQETDDLQVKVRSALFEVEKTMNPIDAMFLYRILDWTGDLADRSLSVGNRLEILVAQ